jgi:hypothetical protein
LHALLEIAEIETQTEIPVTEETLVQTEGVFPIDLPSPLETIEIGTQKDAPTTIETFVQTEEASQPPE